MPPESSLSSAATRYRKLQPANDHDLAATDVYHQSPTGTVIPDADATMHGSQPTTPPADRWLVSYLIFFLLGCGMVFPWNVFITANAYFCARFRGTEFAGTFQNWFSVGFMMANVSCLGLLLSMQGSNHGRKARNLFTGPIARIVCALLVNAVVFMVCVILTRATEMDPRTSFYINMVLVVVSGISTAWLQNGVFGLASLFPPIYTQAVMSGQGLAGAAVSISQIVSLLLSPPPFDSAAAFSDDDDVINNDDVVDGEETSNSALIYFSFAFGVILLALVGVLILRTRPFFHFHAGQTPARDDEVLPDARQDDSADTAEDESTDLISSQLFLIDQPPASSSSPDRWKVFAQLQPYITLVCLTFTITLCLFPSLVGLILSVNQPTSGKQQRSRIDLTRGEFFVPLAFLVFSLGDWLGKALPGVPGLPIPPRLAKLLSLPSAASKSAAHEPGMTPIELHRQHDDPTVSLAVANTLPRPWPRWKVGMIESTAVLTAMATLRLLFIPLFLVCNVVVLDGVADDSGTLIRTIRARPTYLPLVVDSDVVYMLAVFVFAVTNGWLCTLVMMQAPARVTVGGARGKELGGSMMVFALTLGLALGSGLSFVVRAVFGS